MRSSVTRGASWKASSPTRTWSFIQGLDDQELQGWMKHIVSAVKALAPKWRQTPPTGPWSDGYGRSYYNEGTKAGISVIVHGRTGPVRIETPERAPSGVDDALRDAASVQELSNLTIGLEAWTVSLGATSEDILEAAMDALDDALATPAERGGRWLYSVLGRFNSLLIRDEDVRARFNRVYREAHARSAASDSMET